MKKSYFLMAVAATMFAACSQSDVLNETKAQDEAQAIGFSTYSDKATRGSSSDVLETYHKTFGVWAYKTYEGSETPVMPHYQVMNDDNGSGSHDWDYDGDNAPAGQLLKYWDKRASYTFCAYAPYAAGVTINATSKVISVPEGQYAANQNIQTSWNETLNTGVFSGTGVGALDASTDWMIADVVTRSAGDNELVEEQFSHTMSKLIVCLKTKDDFEDVIKVNSVSVNNVHGEGSYSSDAGWTTVDAGKTINGQIGDIVKEKTFYSMEYLLIPSNDAPNFSVNYTINEDIYDVKNQAIVGITKFAPGTVYTLTVTISADPIHFDAKVTDWAVGSAGSVTIE